MFRTAEKERSVNSAISRNDRPSSTYARTTNDLTSSVTRGLLVDAENLRWLPLPGFRQSRTSR